MKIFAKSSFNITTDQFKQTFMDITGLGEDKIVSYIREEAIPSDKEEDINYLLSYLKAIELRETTIEEKVDCTDTLTSYLNSKVLKFTPTDDKFNIYRRYISEMKKKTKK